MKNAYPKHAMNWKQAVALLERHPDQLAYNPDTGKGIIVANPRLFHLDTPKCLLISMGKSISDAETILDKARGIL